MITERAGAEQLRPLSLPPLEDEPLVSVLIANHNYARFLSDAVQSALAQTYARIEVVVCDDGSTDSSRAVLEDLARKEPAVKVVYQDNKRQSAALTAAFAASSGQVISLLDADDYMRVDKAEKVVRAFREHPDAGIVIHQMVRVDADKTEQGIYPQGADLPEGWLGPRALASGGYIPWIEAGIMSLRREVAERIFPLPESAGQFADVILRGAGAMLAPVVALGEPLAFYRLHTDNAGNTARRFKVDEMLERRQTDLSEVQAAYAALDEWVRREHDVIELPPFESTRPYLERRYVIARLAREPRRRQRALLRRLLALRDALSPALYAFYRVSPALPRPLFKVGLETVYGQGRLKAVAGKVLRRG